MLLDRQLNWHIIILPLKKYRSLAIRNLRFAYGDSQSESELAKIAKLHFSTLSANFYAALKSRRLAANEERTMLNLRAQNIYRKAKLKKRP